MRRSTALLVLGLVLVGGCGTGTGHSAKKPAASPTPPKVKILSDLELKRAVLDTYTVSQQAHQYSYGMDVNERGPGCVKMFDAITWVSIPVREEQVAMDFGSDSYYPYVTSSIATFASAKEAADVLATYRKGLAHCTRLNELSDGVRIVADVSHDTEPLAGTVDAQLNVSISGELRSKRGWAPIRGTYTTVQVDNDVILTAFFTITDRGVKEQTQELTRATLARLRAVIAGKDVPRTQLDIQPYDPDQHRAGTTA